MVTAVNPDPYEFHNTLITTCDGSNPSQRMQARANLALARRRIENHRRLRELPEHIVAIEYYRPLATALGELLILIAAQVYQAGITAMSAEHRDQWCLTPSFNDVNFMLTSECTNARDLLMAYIHSLTCIEMRYAGHPTIPKGTFNLDDVSPCPEKQALVDRLLAMDWPANFSMMPPLAFVRLMEGTYQRPTWGPDTESMYPMYASDTDRIAALPDSLSMESFQQYYLASQDAIAPPPSPTECAALSAALARYYEAYLFEDAIAPHCAWVQVEWAVSRWERTSDGRYLRHATRLIGDALLYAQQRHRSEEYGGHFTFLHPTNN